MKQDYIDTPIKDLSKPRTNKKPIPVERKLPTIKDEEGKMLIGRAVRETETALANKLLRGAFTCAEKLFQAVEEETLPAKLLATAMGIAVDKYIALVALTQGTQTPFTGNMDAKTIMGNVNKILAKERTRTVEMTIGDVDPNEE